MELEPITRQEKIIAGQNLTPITRMEKFLKQYGGGSGGVTSWNDLTDKPFGDNADGAVYPMSGKYVEGMGYVEPSTAEITWDGNTDGLVEFLGYYKASDVVLTPEQLIGQQAVGVMPSGENPFVITEDALKFEDYGFVFEGTVLVVISDEHSYCPKGTYLMSYPTPGVYIGRVTYATETTHPIDQKFLVLTSPNGTQYKLSVADDGTLSAVAAT